MDCALFVASASYADPLKCNLTGYKAAPGLSGRGRKHARRDVGRRQRRRTAHALLDRGGHADDPRGRGPEEGRPVVDAGVERDAGIPRRLRHAPRHPAAAAAGFHSGARRQGEREDIELTRRTTTGSTRLSRKARSGSTSSSQVGGVLGRAALHRRQRRAAADPRDVDSADERRLQPARAAAEAGRSEARDGDLQGAGLRR